MMVKDEFDDRELKPEYKRKLARLSKQKGIRFKNIEELRRHIEGDNLDKQQLNPLPPVIQDVF